MDINEINDLSSGHEEWTYKKDLRVLQELIVVLNHLLKIENTPILAEKINYIKKTRSENLSAVFLSPEGRQYITLCYLAIKFEDKNEIISNYCKWVGIESKDILSYLLKRLNLFIIGLKLSLLQDLYMLESQHTGYHIAKPVCHDLGLRSDEYSLE